MSVSKVVAWPDGRSWYIILERVIISGEYRPPRFWNIRRSNGRIYISIRAGIGKSEYRESFNGPSLAKIVSGRWYSTERRDVANSKPAVVE